MAYQKERLRRTMMFIPGNNPGMMKDAHLYGADSLMFDLEDSVKLAEKDAARSQIIIASRAAGIAALDTVYSDINNEEGFRKEVQLIKDLGFDGKSVLNPRQISPVVEIFTPTKKEIEQAEKIIEALKEAESKGLGVVSLNGKMIDKPVVKRAKRALELAEAAGIYKIA